MARSLIRNLLLATGVERCIRAEIVFRRLMGMIPGAMALMRRTHRMPTQSLEREVFGLRFPNPIGLAAGFDTNAEVYREMAALGFGFIETGSITPCPQSGKQRARLFRRTEGEVVSARAGHPNRGLEYAVENLRRKPHDVTVGCNITRNAATPPDGIAADYLRSFRNLYQYADYFAVDICGDGSADEEAITDKAAVKAILEPLFAFRRGQNQYRPILLKISPDLTDGQIDDMTDIMIETPLDGIIAAGATRRREGVAAGVPSKAGGVSGSPLRNRAVEVVRRIHERSNGTYPIIGAGGIATADDVKAMFDAGASLVQLCTSYILEGPQVVRDICRGLAGEGSNTLQ